jgi:hypothetical protein
MVRGNGAGVAEMADAAKQDRRSNIMSDEVEIQLSPEETAKIQAFLSALASRTPVNLRPIGPFITVDDRCNERWPMASRKHKQRIRDVALARYRCEVGREPYKLNGYVNGTYVFEMEYLAILDRSIDIVRNKVDEENAMPLFNRRGS